MPTPSGSLSSDYYDNDPDFLEALNHVDLGQGSHNMQRAQNGDDALSNEDSELPPSIQPSPPRKRARSPEDGEQGSQFHQVLYSVDSNADDSSYLASNTYGASRFGEFGEYMARKRAKLQIQNTEMDTDEGRTGGSSRIFQGLQIYINGWTNPSVQDLRQLIIRHGGIYHPYLDKKGLVTHMVTCSLTPAKVREFQHMKVVGPEWLVESAKAGQLLPWHNFRYQPDQRLEASQGKKTAQKSLFEGFASQTRTRSVLEDEGLVTSTRNAARSIHDQPIAGPSRITEDVRPSTPISPPKKKSTNTPPRPLYTTDPSTRVPEYAAHTSNLNAERAMANPAWRAAHTSVAPDFVEGYYKNSRLHHLSAWKAELKNLVAEAQDRVEDGTASRWGNLPEDDTAVNKIVHENISSQGRDNATSDDVSMRGAQLIMKSPAKGKGKGKEKAANDEERVIMHCDFDSFFVSAGLLDRPHLRGKTVVVCHSQGSQGGSSSTSEIASASYEARKFGVKGGMSLQQARKLCPTIITIPYEFQRYKQLSLQFYTILMTHADDLQAVSVDEALIDVTSSVNRIRTEIARSQDHNASPADPAKDFAEAIRAQVKEATGCEVSIGIAHNIMLARVASRKAKPAGSFHIFPKDAQETLAPLDIDDLHGFGYSARQKVLEKLGATNLGELATRSKATLCDALGKGSGEVLYKAIRGVDDRTLESDKPRKSVSCDINYGIRFENNAQAEAFIYQVAEEVARRLDAIDMRGRSLTLKVMKRDPSAPVEAPKFLGHGICETFSKQTPLIVSGGRATSDHRVIGDHAWRLLKSFSFDPKELRGISIQIQKLEKGSAVSAAEGAQAVLPFKAKTTAADPPPEVASGERANNAPNIVVQPPSQNDDEIQIVEPPQLKVNSDVLDLPSFSQVDMNVFEALPDDVRKELQTEYKRRSITPGAAGDRVSRSRSPSFPPPPKGKITVKGTSVRRITQQLAPRSRPSISPTKSSLFKKHGGPSTVRVSEQELQELNIDPEVFVMLPVNLQREQLDVARHSKRPGASVYFSQRKTLKPRKPKPPTVPLYRAPPPQAKYLEPLFLKQQGQAKGEKLYFTETEDIQGVIEAWVNGFTQHPPNRKDVEYFAKFLTQCVDSARSSDTGIEKAIAVLKWWRILLRRYFGVWENVCDDETANAEGPITITSEVVARAWWSAFREVKSKMDIVARKKFGGCLSLR